MAKYIKMVRVLQKQEGPSRCHLWSLKCEADNHQMARTNKHLSQHFYTAHFYSTSCVSNISRVFQSLKSSYNCYYALLTSLWWFLWNFHYVVAGFNNRMCWGLSIFKKCLTRWLTKFLATSRPAGLSFSPGATFLLPSLSWRGLQRHQGSRWIRPPMHSCLPQSARIAFRAERWNLQFSNNTIILDDYK